jgi:hypothetical protein
VPAPLSEVTSARLSLSDIAVATCWVGSSTSTRPRRSPASRWPNCPRLLPLRLRSPGIGLLNWTTG